MTQLHLIQDSITLDEFNRQLQRYASDGDQVLFLNSALNALLQKDFMTAEFEIISPHNTILAIQEQLDARGLSKHLESKNIQLIEYSTFVAMSLKASKIISW